jgi:ubiquinone/menaquinone biosynthesis C-methylase UbiE
MQVDSRFPSMLKENTVVTKDHASEYDRSFYSAVDIWARDSAEQIVPIVTSLIRPRSVVDVGCGTGAWLAAFAKHGVERYLRHRWCPR